MTKKEEIDFKLWSTSITRFNASKRVSSWKHCMRWSLLGTSVYITILSVLLYSHKIQVSHDETSQFASIFLSILVLCLSLAVNLNQLETKAFKYHECGRKIRRLLTELSATEDEAEIKNILKTYDDILDKYENHNSLDYYQFVVEHSKKFKPDQKQKKPPCYILYLWFPFARYTPQLFLYTVFILVPFLMLSEIVSF